jgi:hypothetical protein
MGKHSVLWHTVLAAPKIAVGKAQRVAKGNMSTQLQ